MFKHLVFTAIITSSVYAMDFESKIKEVARTRPDELRKLYFPNVKAAQTEQGTALALRYFEQLLPLQMPNGLKIQMSATYIEERDGKADLPRIIPALKEYICHIIADAFSYRAHYLSAGQTGTELQLAINCANADINASSAKKEYWENIGAALKGYHQARNAACVIAQKK
jgi:hypothetical protein